MEADIIPEKENVFTSTTNPSISFQDELTYGNQNPRNYIENRHNEHILCMSDLKVNHQMNNIEKSDCQDVQFGNGYAERTNYNSKINDNSPREKSLYISNNSKNINCDDSEVGSFHENQEYNPLMVSKCEVNLKTNSDKEIQLCDNNLDCKLKNSDNDVSPIEYSESHADEISKNISRECNSKDVDNGVSNKKYEISTLFGKIISLNANKKNKPNKRKKLRFESQRLQTRDPESAQGDTSADFEIQPKRTNGELKRFSKRVSIAIQFCKQPEPIVEGVDDDRLWTEAKSFKPSALLVLWWALVALIMYFLSVYDLWSDSAVAYYFYIEGYVQWSIISCYLLLQSYFIQCCFSYYELTHDDSKQFGRLGTKKYAIPLFIFMPWIIVFIGIYDTYKNKYTRRLETAYIMMFIEVIFESLPQTSLQLYAICNYAHNSKPVTNLQWISVSSSILFLSIGIAYSVIFYNNKKATQWIKLVFCVFGAFTVVSRLLLCSSWALRNLYLYLVPFSSGCLTTSLTWLALRSFSRFGYKKFLTKYDIYNLPMTLTVTSSWLTSYIFNCFSPSGIPVAVLMCLLSGIDFYLKLNMDLLPQFDITLAIINLSLTTFVLVSNIVFSVVPKCNIISDTWIEGEGDDEDDPYHFRFY